MIGIMENNCTGNKPTGRLRCKAHGLQDPTKAAIASRQDDFANKPGAPTRIVGGAERGPLDASPVPPGILLRFRKLGCDGG
jgi:hypothetical protein